MNTRLLSFFVICGEPVSSIPGVDPIKIVLNVNDMEVFRDNAQEVRV
ncbi:MAG TPA: hypothetical protein VGL53_32305 [Bryobacteraceae bacterium]|jgi:hypothetical protein